MILYQIIQPFKKFWQFVLANLVLGLIIALFMDGLDTPVKILIGSVWGALISITQWLGHAYFQYKIGEKISWLNQPLKRFIVTLFQIVVYSVIAFAVVQYAMYYFVVGSIPEYMKHLNSTFWLYPIVISSLIALVLSAISFLKSWRKEVLEKERLKNEMLTYKYEALRNQINPHFMFNSLNVLTDLVYEDPKKAVNFIHKFSDIYRYVLDSREKELIPLEEELNFIDKYIFLLKTRFENKLIINIDITPQPNEFIVPLALQLLIENAVKHNEVSTKNNLTIKVTRNDDNYLVVSNSIQPKNIGETSKKIGLKNLKQQYGFFTDLNVEVVEDKNNFIVKLPIITKA